MFKKSGHYLFLCFMISILVLGGCQGSSTSGSTTNTEGTSSKEGNEVKELVVAARAGAMADALKAIVPAYKEETGIAINVVDMPYDNLKETIVLDIQNKGGAYDLVMMDDPWMPEFGEGNMLVELDSYFEDGLDEDYIENGVALGKHPYNTGKLIALPFIGNVQMFYYRSDLLDKYKLKAPTTWDDVVENAKEIVDKEPDTYGYAVRGQRGNPIVSDYLPLFWGYGGEVFNENMEAQVNSQAGIEAMNTYLDLKELSPKGVETFDSDQIATSLTQGQIGMTIAWPSWVSQVDNAESSKVVGKIEFSAIPGQDGNASAMIGNWMLGIPQSSKKVNAAVDFMKWVTSKEIQKEMAKQGGGAPTRESLYNDEELIKMYRHYPAQLEALKNSVERPRTPKWSQIEDTWGMYLSQILVGQLEVEDGLNKANDEIQRILDR
ncbi:ABC transporter substrate-binding protein [Metabacillus sp. HB246100]